MDFGAAVALAILLVLLAFVVLLLISAFFHLKWMVAFVPTPRGISDAMIDAAQIRPGERVYDLGAGDGRVLARAMQRVPGIRAIGYEGSVLVYVLARLRNLFSRHKPEIRMENFFETDLSDADVIFTYLSVAAMQRLKEKFARELKPGTRVVSHAFTMKGLTPDFVKDVPMSFMGTTRIHLYRWK